MPRRPKPPEDFLYTLQTGAESYIITKWDSIGFEQLSQYIMPTFEGETGCTCPQGLKPTCRHRKMLDAMLCILDQPYMYRYGTEEYLTLVEGNLSVVPLPSDEPKGPTGIDGPIDAGDGTELELEEDGDIEDDQAIDEGNAHGNESLEAAPAPSTFVRRV